MKELRNTKQREEVLNAVRTLMYHPTAEEVYLDVSRKNPSISKGTVYRNLTLLNDLGEVRTIYAGTGADHFDANMMPHDHFICRNCHSIQDLPHIGQGEPTALAGESFTGVVEESYTYYYGLCAVCKQLLAGSVPDNK